MLEGLTARLALPDGGALRIALPETLAWRILRAPYYPEFGRELERTVLVGEGENVALAAWRFDPGTLVHEVHETRGTAVQEGT